MKIIACILAILFTANVYAARTDDLCTLAKTETHSFRCKVIHSEESESRLLIKKDVRDSDTEERKARARLLMSEVIEMHFSEGGGGVRIRFIGKDGAWYERPCNRIKNTFKPYCYDAERVNE